MSMTTQREKWNEGGKFFALTARLSENEREKLIRFIKTLLTQTDQAAREDVCDEMRAKILQLDWDVTGEDGHTLLVRKDVVISIIKEARSLLSSKGTDSV